MSKICKLVTLVALLASASSCATVLNGDRYKIYVTPPPGTQFTPALAVSADGQPLKVEPADTDILDFLPKGSVSVEVTSRDDHVLTVTDGVSLGTFATGTELAIGWLFLNLFTTGPIGIVVDWSTHAWRRPTPLVIHVPARRGVAKR
jgi:hypothetical protein